MATVKAIIKKNKIDSEDNAPIYLRITQNRKTRYISLGKKIPVEHWNPERERVDVRNSRAKALNRLINKKVSEAEEAAIKIEISRENFAVTDIKAAIKGQTSPNFVRYFEQYLKNLDSRAKTGTHDKASATLSKLKTFLNGKPLTFRDLDTAFLKKYDKYLREELGNGINTITSNLKIFRKLWNDADAEGILNGEKYPFKGFPLVWIKAKKEPLNDEQVLEFWDLEIASQTRMEQHRDMFVFACYTGGLRISDILTLRWCEFDGKVIRKTCRKTGKELYVPVPTKGLEIFEKYRAQKSSEQDFVFPPLKEKPELKDYKSTKKHPKMIHKTISSSTAYANKNLNIMASKLEIPFKVGFHTSRHTFGVRAIRRGMSPVQLQKVMGHSKITQTMEYVNLANIDIDQAMEVMND